MKKTLVLLFALIAVTTLSFAADKWPSPQGYVNDFANVVPADQKQILESFLTQVEQQTGSQIAVVTIPSVDEGDIDGAAAELFKKWGIGQKGKDNGILILAAVQDHKVRMEVGYGLEAVITDGQAGEIIRQYVRPNFKQGDYGQGLSQGAAAAAQMIAASEGITLNNAIPVQTPAPDRGSNLGFWIQVGFVLFIVLFNVFFRSHRGFFGGGYYGGGWGGGGFGGNGGGGGGFGGFSGGGSGGGGASGGW